MNKEKQSGDCGNCNGHIDDTSISAETLQQLVESIAEVFLPVLEATWETLKKVMQAVLYLRPNKRVLHLAKHHPKERVRKKNMHRIIKWVKKKVLK